MSFSLISSPRRRFSNFSTEPNRKGGIRIQFYLPGPDALQGGEVPDPNLAAVAGGEEKLVVGAESEGGDGLGVSAVDGGANGGVGGIDDLDRLSAGADEEGAVG